MIEFNELCPDLLDQWARSGELPNFAQFYNQAEVYTTEADEAGPPYLEPWIQWYSIHTGLPYRVHGVFHLTDGPRANHPDIWSVLRAHGKTVFNCSSMNARRLDGDGTFFLPDPWCDTELPNPLELAPFSKFIARQVKEYSNRDYKQSMRDASAFVRFMIWHGLSSTTVFSIIAQLLLEILSGGRSSWRRAAIQDQLLFDVFRFYYRKIKPDFATFFVNSTAHLQHSYWRHMDPAQFSLQPGADEIQDFKGAILFGYQKMDRLLGKFMRLAGDDTTLVFASALSQQPYRKYEEIGGHHFYRPRAIATLLTKLDIRPKRIEPVMTHQFLARFESSEEAREARRRLSLMRLGTEPVFGFDPTADDSIYFGCQLRTEIPASAVTTLCEGASRSLFFDDFYQIEALKSGCHHPDGCLWVRQGKHRRQRQKVSILDIFPTILDYFDVPVGRSTGKPLLWSAEGHDAATH